ncbi:MAG: VCBS repeat-containing protein [Elusimicrobia bacterium]|nr:VCBS repeat-containing protein [Elusimicrobiota bacterium]
MEKKLYPILLSLLAVILLVSPFTWAMSPPTNLLVDGMVKPTNFIFDPEIQDNLNDGGLENPNPTFSWVPTGNQTAYRIIVGDSSFNVEIGIGNMWDSTKIESINTSAIYEGDPLESNKVYYWSVITWDENDTPSFPEDSSEKLYYENFQMNHFIKALEFDGHSNDMAAFAAGDINNNSLTDFIVASYGPGRIYAYINQGDGTFHQQLIADETQTYPEALLLIDTNNNGNLDLVVTNVKSPHEQIDIYLNDGFGNFTYSGKLSDYTSVASKALSAADLNRDGYMDLVEGMSGGTYGIQVYINKKDGSFEQPVAYANGKKVNDLTLIDFNNDSYPDILIGCNGSNQLYLNKGDGTFELSWTSDEEDNTYAITPVDFNSDGLWDFIEGNYVKSGESEVGCTDRYYKNNGDGTFDLVYSTDKLDATLAISAGDINLDGKLDYVTGNGKSSEKNRVYLNDIFYNDNSNSSPFNPYMASTFFTEVYRTLLFDLTGDGRMDLLRGIEGANDILLINNSVEPNTPPSPPRDNFSSHYSKTTAKLKLSWGDGSDAHTPANQLAYNIRISTNPDARTSPESVKWNVVSGAIGTSDHAGSFWGNIGRSTYVYLSIPPQTYFWQVQSIDTSKKQGEWSDVQIYNTPPEGNISSLVQGDLASHFQTEPELKYLESSRFLTNISFSIRDLEANDCFLTEFEYSTSSTADWMGIDDDSASLMGDWPDRGGDYFQASDEWGENYSFVWQTSESLREGLKSDSVRIRFKVSDIHGASSIVTSG